MSWTTKRQIRKSLKSLGKNKDEVANTLKTLGIKGNTSQPYSCPIARYLNQAFQLTGYDHTAWATGTRAGFMGTEVKVPHAVGDFIHAFDEHQYPEVDTTSPPFPWGDDA